MISLGQLISLAGLDKASVSFSAKPSGDYVSGQPRLNATRQMRTILENSRLDESILSRDLQRAGCAVKLPADPTLRCSYDQPPVGRNALPGSKFDELYQQALRNAESILSDSGNPPDDHVALQNLHSPVRPADYCELSDSDSLAGPAGLHPVGSYVMQNGHVSASNTDAHKTNGELADGVHSHHSGRQEPSAGAKSQGVNRSTDSTRVDEMEISEEYTTEDDSKEM